MSFKFLGEKKLNKSEWLDNFLQLIQAWAGPLGSIWWPGGRWQQLLLQPATLPMYSMHRPERGPQTAQEEGPLLVQSSYVDPDDSSQKELLGRAS